MNTDDPAAHANGLPPKVLPCVAGSSVPIFSLSKIAPIGIPPAMLFATVTMSG
jgi:hypothetical protein